MAARTFTMVCGPDDFLVGRAGAERWAALSAGLDDFSREVISGYVGVVDDVAAVVRRFREAVQTLGLFGGRRAVWLKDVTFLADSELGETLARLGPRAASDHLVRLARERARGGGDNLSLAIVKLEPIASD